MRCPKCGYDSAEPALACGLCSEPLRAAVSTVADTPTGDTVRFPTKPPGSRYTILFRSDHSLANSVAAVFVGGSFPVPDFGTNCVCCSATTSNKYEMNPVLATQQFEASEVQVPMCRSCELHAAQRGFSTMAAIGLLILGILGLAFGFYGGMGFRAYGCGGLLTIAGVGWLLALDASRRRLAREGHFADFGLSAMPGQLSVQTRNAPLARQLARQNAVILHEVS